mgnify:CR=1 FL=1
MKSKHDVGVFGDRLRNAIRRRDMSVAEVADKAGISQTSIFYYMSNSANPSLFSLVNLAKVLNVSLDWLVGLKPFEYQQFRQNRGNYND